MKSLKLTILVIFFLSVFLFTSFADLYIVNDKDGNHVCITNIDTEIAEYMELGYEMILISEITPVGTTGKWSYDKRINPIDDTVIVSFVLECVEIPFRSPVLILRYRDKETNLYIEWHEYFSKGTTSVTYRFDTERAKTGSWLVSTSNDSTFYPYKSKDTIKFIQRLMEADRFVVRATPYGSGPRTITFDIRGLKNAVKQFNNVLPW